MDFVIGIPILANWKSDNYDSILLIVDQLMKIIHYKPVKVTINVLSLAKMIINVGVRHHRVPQSIVTDRDSLLTSKFWSLLCYFLGIKRKLSTTFYPQTNGRTKRQNSMMKMYFRVFVN